MGILLLLINAEIWNEFTSSLHLPPHSLLLLSCGLVLSQHEHWNQSCLSLLDIHCLQFLDLWVTPLISVLAFILFFFLLTVFVLYLHWIFRSNFKAWYLLSHLGPTPTLLCTTVLAHEPHVSPSLISLTSSLPSLSLATLPSTSVSSRSHLDYLFTILASVFFSLNTDDLTSQ